MAALDPAMWKVLTFLHHRVVILKAPLNPLKFEAAQREGKIAVISHQLYQWIIHTDKPVKRSQSELSDNLDDSHTFGAGSKRQR